MDRGAYPIGTKSEGSILQQDPIRWAPVTNIHISGQQMFRTEFIDK